ncbi:MAG: pantoate--beta-alanine ligase [Candidatus Theseobacter exili]|nr:pantoate--beta-alanine ligase [Candidatus Theseobacter exili]
MKIINTIAEMKEIVRAAKSDGKNIALVPTLGYLHEGHVSLIKHARKAGDLLVVSLFVNPLQFCPGEDFEKYPRNEGWDHSVCRKNGVDIIFNPMPEEMFSVDHSTYVNEESLSQSLCGKTRPGHFRGVATIVAKLFNIICPSVAVFGQKDAQQALIIKRVVRDLNIDVEIVVLSTVRDQDGLALSSRNEYLNIDEKQDALCLHEALSLARILVSSGERETKRVIKKMEAVINQRKTAKIDYIKVTDSETLHSSDQLKGSVLIALAVYIGKARLIDNVIVHIEEK